MGILKLKKDQVFTLDQALLQEHESGLEIRSDSLQEFRIKDIKFAPKKIGLYCPNLKKIDAALWSLPKLEIVAIKAQSIREADLFSPPPGPSPLAPIRILRLSGLSLTQIPEWIGRLTALQELDLNNNQLQALPLELMQIKNLGRINLEQNQFSAIPVCLTRMPWINHLALDGNPLSESERQLAFDLWGIWF